MSGLEALGAAAAIAQFAVYGVNLARKAVQVYQHGATKPTEEMETRVDEFRAQNKIMLAIYQDGRPLSGVEKNLQVIAFKCDQVASDLVEQLKTLRNPGRRSVWKSLRVAINDNDQSKEESEIRRCERRLNTLRKQLSEQVLSLLSERQSELQKTLSRIEGSTKELGSDLSSGMNRLRNDLLAAIEGQSDQSIHTLLFELQREAEVVIRRQQILSSLRYELQQNRHEEIQEAQAQSYEWIFDNQFQCRPRVSAGVRRASDTDKDSPDADKDTVDEPTYLPLRYVQWLREGNGLYWIEGRPGCGKSTLVKYIADHKRTAETLRVWADGRRLIMGSHYFWISGGVVQRSFDGLLRSLLWDVLRQSPELIETVCRARFANDVAGRDARSMPWTLSELKQCLTLLASAQSEAVDRKDCFCFFIDGLDEYDADMEHHEEIIQLLHNLAKVDNVKICVSSREWEVFKTGFEDSVRQGHHLLLHLYTEEDISKVVHHHLDPVIQDRQQNDQKEVRLFIDEIINKAEGVFLWVRVVVRELLEGFQYADSISDLRDRLSLIPGDLEAYFERIFDRIPRAYRQKSARIIQACLTAAEPLPIQLATFLESDDPVGAVLNMPTENSYDWSNHDFAIMTRKQINGRCQDLLVIDVLPERPSMRKPRPKPVEEIYRMQFLHRTVRDWLYNEKIAALAERAGSSYDPARTLFAAYVFLLKKGRSLGSLEEACATLTDWSTHALLYASSISGGQSDGRLIQDLDSIMTTLIEPFVDNSDKGRHWTNHVARTLSHVSVGPFEKGCRDLLGHTIELGLCWYARQQLLADPTLLVRKQSKGRPYFDYALRLCPVAAHRMSLAHDSRLWTFDVARSFPKPRMVKLFLDLKCDINAQVWIQGGRTLWDLFLEFIWKTNLRSSDAQEVVWLLIEHGARHVSACEVGAAEHSSTSKYQDIVSTVKKLPMQEILSRAFGDDEAQKMCRAVENNSQKSWFRIW